MSGVTPTDWIADLAMEEINMDQSGEVFLDEHLGAQKLLEKAGVAFVDELKSLFHHYVTVFNDYRGADDSTKIVKIFKISGSVNDFMLFRHSLKLVVTRRALDTISVGLIHNSSNFAPRTTGEGVAHLLDNYSHELKATVGPFHDVKWRYQGEPVDPPQLVKHYLTEFLRLSAQ